MAEDAVLTLESLLSGCSLCTSSALAQSWLCRHCHPHAGARHRCNDGDLLDPERLDDSASPLKACAMWHILYQPVKSSPEPR